LGKLHSFNFTISTSEASMVGFTIPFREKHPTKIATAGFTLRFII
jgi:hypothetical protein